MARTAVVFFKVAIALLIALLGVCQIVVIPATAVAMGQRYPEFASLVVPGTVIGIVFVLSAQVVLVCVWRLLSLVRADSIFTDRAYVWVDLSLWCVALATALVVGSLVLLSLAGASPPSITLLCLIGIVVGGCLSLLIVVLRGLVRKASQLEHDLSEVV